MKIEVSHKKDFLICNPSIKREKVLKKEVNKE